MKVLILKILYYYYITWPFLGKEIDLKSININNKNILFKILTSVIATLYFFIFFLTLQ